MKAIIVDSKRHCRFYCSENNEFDTCGQTRDPVSFVSTSSPSLSSTSSSVSTEYRLNINRDNNILELSFLNLKQKEKPFYIDFRDYIQQRGGSHGHNMHSHVKNELIYKAFGKPLPSTRKYLQQLFSLSESPQSDDFQSIGQSQMGSPSTEVVIDLTAGLCRDSTILALCGLDVIAIEKNKLLYDLLTDGMKRYTTEKQHAMLDSRNKLPDLSLSIHHGDSTCAITTHDILLSWLRQQVSIYSLKQQGFHSSSSSFTLKNEPDSITSDGNISSCDNTAWLKEILKSVSISVFLDPMYPAGFVGKKALVKKETQVLHRYATLCLQLSTVNHQL